MKETQLDGRQRIVLAFSGGLDTSWCVPWLRETLGAEVVTVTVDAGGFDAAARQDLESRSRALGATRHVHVHGRRMLWDDVLRFLLMGNVLRGNSYPLCVGAERSLQAREVARVAREVGATAVAHGSTAAGNDHVRFEIALRTLAPDLDILAPVREHAPSRAEQVRFLGERRLPVPAAGGAYSVNSGLWGTTIGGRETNDTRQTLPEEAWVRTRGAFDAPRADRVHRIAFERGVPSTLDDTPFDPVALVEAVDLTAAAFGIGRGIHLGDTIFGLKGRVAFEAPAATVLIATHRELEKLVLTARQQTAKDQAARLYGEWVHEGQWLEPACRDLEALLLSSQARVTGEVVVRMRPGHLFVEGVSSPFSLRDASTAVYGEAASEWTPSDARGFARLVALPSMLHARAASGRPAVTAGAETPPQTSSTPGERS